MSNAHQWNFSWKDNRKEWDCSRLFYLVKNLFVLNWQKWQLCVSVFRHHFHTQVGFISNKWPPRPWVRISWMRVSIVECACVFVVLCRLMKGFIPLSLLPHFSPFIYQVRMTWWASNKVNCSLYQKQVMGTNLLGCTDYCMMLPYYKILLNGQMT